MVLVMVKWGSSKECRLVGGMKPTHTEELQISHLLNCTVYRGQSVCSRSYPRYLKWGLGALPASDILVYWLTDVVRAGEQEDWCVLYDSEVLHSDRTSSFSAEAPRVPKKNKEFVDVGR